MTWLGVDPASLIGQHVRVLMGDVGYSQIGPHMERALAGELVQYERELTLADGRTIYAQMNYVPDKDEQGRTQGYVALVHDLTERRRAELREVEAREQAEAGNRAKDEFLALLGHELRNPLAPILTALELMKLGDADAFATERSVIERQLKHVVRLVDDLLDVSRITRGKVLLERQEADLADVIASALESTSPLFEQHAHRLSVRVPRGLVVDGDAVRLAQVFANLLTNAAKYTPRAGEITVEGEVRDGRARVSVRDTGIGIRPEMLPRVFDLFAQERQALDRAGGGLGIGLSIVRSLVEMHGGRVEARSQGTGRGSEFSVVLQVVAEPSAKLAVGSQRSQPVRSGGRCVLVVDDNEDAAGMLAAVLRRWGHVVRVAHDGPAALKIALEFTPDVALLDIGLPAMDGYELARRLRALPLLGNVQLVAVTGYGQARDREAAELAGFQHHVVKPVDFGLLKDVLSRTAPAPSAA
jgi:PAS domain S-box-containing protein